MRKRMLLTILSAFLIAGVLFAANNDANPNLIENADLESWSGSSTNNTRRPTGFTFHSNINETGFYTQSGDGEGYGSIGRALRLRTSSIKGKDGKALQVGQTAFTTSNIVFPESDYDVEHCYEFSFYTKGHGRIDILNYNKEDANKSLIPFRSYKVSSDWLKTSGSFLHTPTVSANNAPMQIRFYDFKQTYFYFDEMSLVKLPNNLATIRSIGVKDPISEYGNYLADFDPDVFEYTVELPNYVDTIPELIIDPMNKLATVETNYLSIKNFSEGESSKQMVISVTSKDETETNEYTITFNRKKYVLEGYSDMFTNPLRGGIAESANFSANEAYKHGQYLGAYSIRPVVTNAYFITSKLKKGANKISFMTGKYLGSSSELATAKSEGVEVSIRISYTTEFDTESPTWQLVGEHIIDLDKDAWENVEFNINSNSPNAQVKMEYLCGGSTIIRYAIDDVAIAPYPGPLVDNKIIDMKEHAVYSQNHQIVIKELGQYQVFTLSGQMLVSGYNAQDMAFIPVENKGVYIVKTANKIHKVLVL